MNETIKMVLGILGTIISFIGPITILIVKYAKSEKIKKNAQKINFWMEQAGKLVREAENLINKNGEEKKEYVMANIKAESKQKGYAFESDKVSDIIENIIDMTKDINSRQKDKKAKVIKLMDSKGTNETNKNNK